MKTIRRYLGLFLCLLTVVLVLPQAALAADAPVLTLSEESAGPGENVTVSVELKKNPGLMCILFRLSYDHSRLTLKGAEGVGLSGWDRNGDRLLWLGEKDDKTTGTILKLVFHVAEDAAVGDVSVTLLCGEGDLTNENEDILVPGITAGKVTIRAGAEGSQGVPVPVIETKLPDIPFKDVPENAYYRDAVAWAYDKGVTKGRSNEVFDPQSTCTRGEVVTFLWRAAGSVKPSSTENPFVDVKETDYYFEPVLWAVEKGITFGTDSTHFTPKKTCSTAHIITFLYRSLGIGQDGWYKAAGDWANGCGLMEKTGLLVDPSEACPRCAVVTFLYRWSQQQ